MSFSPEIFRKKLDSLQETQDSIVSISQWVLFHHRHAADLCQIWASYAMGDGPAINLTKRLALLYLCNDVVQQARHKRKPEFAAGFAKALPKVLHQVYPKLDSAIKPKLERLIGVWEQRNIFTAAQIQALRHSVELLKSGKPLADTLAPEKGSPQPTGVATDLVHLNNLFNHMAQLLELSLSNLSQVGYQSKQYLPHDMSALDNLPLPKVYISKLNVLEKLCNMTTQNLQDVKKAREEILAVLSNLQSIHMDGLKTDDSKLKIISQKLEKLHSTRLELQDMADNDNTEADDEEASPVFETTTTETDNDDLVPTYETSSDEEDDKPASEAIVSASEDDGRYTPNSPKKRKLSDSSTSSRTSKKSVAFSEDIEVKEFERDEETDVIKILPSESDSEEDYVPIMEPKIPDDLKLFESHHKDDLELLHDRQHTDSDGYEPSQEDSDSKSGLLDLLSKLS